MFKMSGYIYYEDSVIQHKAILKFKEMIRRYLTGVVFLFFLFQVGISNEKLIY